MTWSAQQYVMFEDERTRPVRDLLAAMPAVAARTAVDLGCGPGNSTELLAARYPDAVVRGVDSDASMIGAARARLPALEFELQDINRWLQQSPRVDVILANAALQWVPDHDRLFPALLNGLRAGGCLGVQMPDNLDEPAHRCMREVAAEGPWAAKLAAAAAARPPIHGPQRYFEMLAGRGCAVDVWRTTYHHRLRAGTAGVVDWFKGSALRPYLEGLDPDERAQFLFRFEAAVARCHDVMADGSLLLPFPRLFIVART